MAYTNKETIYKARAFDLFQITYPNRKLDEALKVIKKFPL